MLAARGLSISLLVEAHNIELEFKHKVRNLVFCWDGMVSTAHSRGLCSEAAAAVRREENVPEGPKWAIQVQNLVPLQPLLGRSHLAKSKILGETVCIHSTAGRPRALERALGKCL